MKKCCVFYLKPSEFIKNKKFEKIKDYGTISTPQEGHRNLLKCTKCGALFIHQSFSWNDDYYNDYIQVESEQEADFIHQNLNWLHFKTDKNPMILWGKEVQYRNTD